MADPREIALAACASACLFACDVVQGFQRSGDALFPEVRTYLDVPGYRVIEGHFGWVDVITSSEPFIIARSATPGDDTLFAMRYHAPKPCAIPSVARFWTDGGFRAERTYIAYSTASEPEVLRFSDMSCTPFTLSFPTPHLPHSYSASGLVVEVDRELLDVEPSTGEKRLLASELEQVDAGQRVVRAGGRLGVFDGNWQLVRWVGEDVVGYVSAFGSLYYEDAAGISRLTIADSDGVRTATTTPVASDACGLTVLPETPKLQLLTFYEPCAERRLMVWDSRSHRSTPLELDLDPRYLRLYAQRDDGGRPDLAKDPFFALYLSEVDPESDTGKLHVFGSDGVAFEVGERAALERAELVTPAGGGDFSGGFALIDVEGETGRYVRFELTGSVTEVSPGVLRRPSESAWDRLVIDVDGTLAELAEVVDGAPHVVARDVPRRRYAYVQRSRNAPLFGSMAWFHDLNGDTGSLSLARQNEGGVLDDQKQEPLYEGTLVARDVHQDGHGFLYDLPGLLYFTHWNDATRTGRLEYSNVELGFTAVVSDGVADYVQPGTGLLYTIPAGPAAGIWLARSK